MSQHDGSGTLPTPVAMRSREGIPPTEAQECIIPLFFLPLTLPAFPAECRPRNKVGSNRISAKTKRMLTTKLSRSPDNIKPSLQMIRLKGYYVKLIGYLI